MQQITDTLLMVRPQHFGYDPETASNNAFQVNDPSRSVAEIKSQARYEFDQLVDVLQSAGVQVIVVEDTDTPVKPDAVFPNNWFTTHENGSIITYPLHPVNRRAERRQDLLDMLIDRFEVHYHIRLEHQEQKGHFLEGTGSMILDRQHRIAYACRSARTNEAVLNDFTAITGFRPILFDATDDHHFPIYHTNVMMALGETFVIIALGTVRDAADRTALLRSFANSQKSVIELSIEQMMSFAGNMLQVRNLRGDTFLVMSSQAYRSLSAEQIRQIEAHTSILHSPIPTIEQYGGGSVRCILAEIFLPKGS